MALIGYVSLSQNLLDELHGSHAISKRPLRSTRFEWDYALFRSGDVVAATTTLFFWVLGPRPCVF
jgi:hypothetical protein